MWEALCVSAWRRGAQTEEVWRDRRQSSQRTRFRPDSHKPAGVEKQASCWKVSKTARQRVLIDKNLVQTFLRSVLCSPLFRKMLEMWCWRCRGKQTAELALLWQAEASMVLFYGRILTYFTVHAWRGPTPPDPHTFFHCSSPEQELAVAQATWLFCFVFSHLCF